MKLDFVAVEFGHFALDLRPKACVIPAQGKRPGFIEPINPIYCAEGAIH
jgi:hypothetical protein